MSNKVKEAIILAGGLGTRLRSEIPELPKCMAPVREKPFLHYVIDYCRNQEVETLIFSLGYKYEIVADYLQKSLRDISFICSIENEPLGTGGAIKKSIQEARESTVAVLNGDTMYKASLQELAIFHEQHQSDCTLALKPMQNFNRYGVVEIDAEGKIGKFSEKKEYEQGLINGGVYILNRERFLTETFSEKFSFEKDYLEQYTGKRRFYGCVQDAYFIDIGIPEDYRKAQLEL